MTSGIIFGTPQESPSLVTVPAVRRRRIRLPRSAKILTGLTMLGIFVFLAIFGPALSPYDPGAQSSSTVGLPQPPSAAHLLGTTNIQQDVLSQLLTGTQPIMEVAFLTGAAATLLSIVIGVSAGYFGRLVDDLLSVLINVSLVLPALPLLIVLTGFLGSGSSANDPLIALIISATGWAWGARVLRVQVLALRNEDFVESARLIGERPWRIIAFEIMPSLIPVIASSFLFTVVYAIGTYASIAYLGLINGTHWSWGTMLFWAQSEHAVQSGWWWWFVPPGLAIALLGTALALLNFGIDEFINPRLRAAGLSRKAARRAGLPRRFRLGLTPVTAQALRCSAQAGPAGLEGAVPGEETGR